MGLIAVRDALLREVSARGLWVSAHPDAIARMGTKEVLYTTRDLGWGIDTALYRTPAEFALRFPARLPAHRSWCSNKAAAPAAPASGKAN